MTLEERILAAVGQLSAGERMALWGPRSAGRRVARERGLESLLPPPPADGEAPAVEAADDQADRRRRAAMVRRMSGANVHRRGPREPARV